MKACELKRLYRDALQQRLPDYTCQGKLLYHTPLEWLLKGFYFESSAFNKSFTVECFIQPLYIPKDSFVFNIGCRLGTNVGRWFEPDELQTPSRLKELWDLIERQGLLFHAPVETPADLVTVLQADTRTANPQHQEAVAYSLCLDSNATDHDVRVALSGLKDMLQPDLKTRWIRAMHDRATQLLIAFDKSPETARRILASWAAHTRQALKLNEAPTQTVK